MVKSGHGGRNLQLIIEDGAENESKEYAYNGDEAEASDSYMLVFNREERTFTVESIASRFRFNMTAAPWEKDATKLAREYQSIGMQEAAQSSPTGVASSAGEDMSGDELGAAPNAANPFDYRHYLMGIPGTSPGARGSGGRSLGGASSGISSTMRAGPRSAVTRPIATAKTAAPKPAARRDVASQKSKPLPGVPQVRLQRRASTARRRSASPSEANDGGLTVEVEEDTRRRQRNTGFLGAPRSSQPVSLRSAAASMSPATHAFTPGSRDPGSGSEKESEDEAGHSDADVDALVLPSPAMTGRERASEEGDEEDADDEVDLEAEFEQALQSAVDDGAREVRTPSTSRNEMREDESEESEEE